MILESYGGSTVLQQRAKLQVLSFSWRHCNEQLHGAHRHDDRQQETEHPDRPQPIQLMK
jgi:hypothetical protein